MPANRRRSQPPSRSESKPARSRLPLVVGIVVALVAGALYLPTLRADFVFDDVAQLVIDDYVHRPAHFADVLTLRVLGDDVLDRNRPLMLLSLLIDSTAWGRWPGGYHLMNVLLHAGCAALVFALFLQLRFCAAGIPGAAGARDVSGADDVPPHRLAGAAFAALLFAVHPVASEAAAAITYREDLLATFFLLLGLLLALRHAAAAGVARVALVAGSALSFVLAVTAKETGAAGPPLLALVWWRCGRAADRRSWAALLAVVWTAVVAFLLAIFVLGPKQSVILSTPEPIASLWEWPSIAARIVVFYVEKIVWPVDLSADYEGMALGGAGTLRIVTALALLFGPPALLAVKVKDAVAWIGVALFWLALFPVSNLVPIYNPVADRYLYTPMAGLALVAGSVAALPIWWRSRARAIVVAGLAVLLLAALARLTLERERVWHDSRSLWSDTLAKNPSSIFAANGLALALHDARQPAAAIALWQRAITTSRQLDVVFAPSWAGLALSLESAGRPAEADQAYRVAIQLDERYRDPNSLVRALTWRADIATELAVIARRCCVDDTR